MEQICADLEAEHAALDAVVADLSEDGWNADTPAEGWDGPTSHTYGSMTLHFFTIPARA